MNVIGTQLRDPTNLGLIRWRMAVLYKYMDAAAELGRNPVKQSFGEINNELFFKERAFL